MAMTTLVPLCSLCRRVRDDNGIGFGQGEWGDVLAYMKRYRLAPADFIFSHTYCPDCCVFYRQLMSYGRGDQSFVDRPAYRPAAGT
jgi:hypothetical protein